MDNIVMIKGTVGLMLGGILAISTGYIFVSLFRHEMLHSISLYQRLALVLMITIVWVLYAVSIVQMALNKEITTGAIVTMVSIIPVLTIAGWLYIKLKDEADSLTDNYPEIRPTIFSEERKMKQVQEAEERQIEADFWRKQLERSERRFQSAKERQETLAKAKEKLARGSVSDPLARFGDQPRPSKVRFE